MYAAMTHKHVFDVRPNDVYACAADIGWITGTTNRRWAPAAAIPVPLIAMPVPLITIPAPLIAIPVPLIAIPAPLIAIPVPLIAIPAPLIAMPVPPIIAPGHRLDWPQGTRTSCTGRSAMARPP